jgi:hypothetical protein
MVMPLGVEDFEAVPSVGEDCPAHRVVLLRNLDVEEVVLLPFYKLNVDDVATGRVISNIEEYIRGTPHMIDKYLKVINGN